MKEFMFIFRQPGDLVGKVSPNEMQALTKKWMDWVSSIENRGNLVSQGNRLSTDGKVLKTGGIITDGPFVEIREILGGFIIIKADNLDEAATLAHGCPALDLGGSVEIRPFYE